MVLSLSGDPQEVITCANFYVYRMSSLGAVGGQKRGFLLKLDLALTTLPCAAALACDVRSKAASMGDGEF